MANLASIFPTRQLMALFIKSLPVTILGGVAAFYLGPAIASFQGNPPISIAVNILLLGLFLGVGFFGLRNNFFSLISNLVAIAIIGSIISLFFPFASWAILSMNNITITGLLLTGIYIGVVNWVLGFLKIRL